MMFRPLTFAEPWLGVETNTRLVAEPVIVGVSVLLVELAFTVKLLAETVGAAPATVILIVAIEELPPGPIAW